MEIGSTILGWAWMIATAILAIALACATLISIILAYRRKRGTFIALAAAFLVLGIISGLANPMINMTLFNSATEKNATHLYEQMNGTPIKGMTPDQLTATFRLPRAIEHHNGYEVWYYNPNPWFMMGWTEIGVRIESNLVVNQWYDD